MPTHANVQRDLVEHLVTLVSKPELRGRYVTLKSSSLYKLRVLELQLSLCNLPSNLMIMPVRLQ